MYSGNPATGASVTPVVGGASATWFGFDLSVLLDGVEVERWNNVSADSADNRFVKTVVNTYSKYVTIPTTSFPIATQNSAPVTTPFSLAGGLDGNAVVAADYEAAINTQLDQIEGVLILNAVGQTSATTVSALNTLATTRGNSFVVVDAATTDDFSSVTSLIQSYPQSSYVSVYYPKLKMIDPTKTGPAAIRDTFPGGAVLGAYSRIDSTRGVAKAPAGYDVDIRNAVGLVTNYTTANTESLYSTYGVNLFKSIPGGGIIINGARTMDKSTPGRYIPIRRSLNYLKQSLTDATQFAIFEPNDERLWTRITMTVSSLLSEFWRSGGLKGTNANEAFYVTCDSTNNTVTTINNGEVRIEVGVALQYPAEFIIINLSQWTGGSNAVSNL
jgi:phage tail sheath protein FI